MPKIVINISDDDILTSDEVKMIERFHGIKLVECESEDCINRRALMKKGNIGIGENGNPIFFIDVKEIEELPSVLPKATKNDLGVDLISRADVLKLMQDNWHTHNGDWAMQESMDDIRALPSVTPQEPKTGKWISTETKGVRYAFWCRYKCSLCGGLSDHTNFCPNCGAKMESEDKE